MASPAQFLTTLVLLSFIVLLIVSQEAEFKRFRDQMQEKVKWLKGNYTNLNQRKSEYQNCSTKSYNLCNGTGTRECLSNFPTPNICATNGIYFSKDGGIRFPTIKNTENLSNEEKQFTCVSAELNSTFSQITEQNKNRHSYTFVGSPTGGMRMQPSFREELQNNACFDYDPRARPWYSSAVSGAKNIILFIDVSGTMETGQRFRKAKEAAVATLNTMGTYDEIGVIAFSEDSKILGNFDSLVRATSDNKGILIEAVEALDTTTKFTNYEDAFKDGIKLYNKSSQIERPCKSDLVFIFITDGKPSQGFSQFDDFKTMLDNSLLELEATLTFIGYALGEQLTTQDTVIQKLACYYGGFVQKLKENDDDSLISKVQNYYDFFWQSTINSTKPFWTDPYEDAFGLGNIVTVSIPIFENQTDSNKLIKMIGVAGIDVLMGQLTKYHKTEQQVVIQLQQQRTCYRRKKDIQPCQLQELRRHVGSDLCQSEGECTFIDEPSVPFNDWIFVTPLDDSLDNQKCCSLTKVEMGSIISLIIILMIGTGTTVFFYKKKKCCWKDPPSSSYVDPSPPISSPQSSSQFPRSIEGNLYEQARKNGIEIYDEQPIDF